MTEPKKRAASEKPAAEDVENSVSPSPSPPKEPEVAAPEPIPSAYAVVGDGEKDAVYMSKIVYKDINHKKSLSSHHLQRRLNELGYEEAYSGAIDGFYDDATARSVEAFQRDHDLEPTGRVDQGTLSQIFNGDDNVELHLY